MGTQIDNKVRDSDSNGKIEMLGILLNWYLLVLYWTDPL